MDCIILKNLEFYGRHGVNPDEKKYPQKFTITAKLYLDLKKAGTTDALSDTISYSKVYKILQEIFEQCTFDLLECLAQTSATILLERYPKLDQVKICVKKPEAPVKGVFDYFAVNIIRNQE